MTIRLLNISLDKRMMLYEKAIKLKKEWGWGSIRISKELNVSPQTISKWIYCNSIPNTYRGKWIDFKPTPELSYVIGATIGDGSVFYKKKSWEYVILLRVTDLDFSQEFNRCICKILEKDKLYKIKKQSTNDYRLSAASKPLFYLLKKGYENLSSYIEEHPAEFIRGFSDAEGSVSLFNRRKYRTCYKSYTFAFIKIWNSDLTLLEYIQKLLLKYFSIGSRIYLKKKAGSNHFHNGKEYKLTKNAYYLCIHKRNDIKRFSDLIGFSIKRKQKRLEEFKEALNAKS